MSAGDIIITYVLAEIIRFVCLPVIVMRMEPEHSAVLKDNICIRWQLYYKSFYNIIYIVPSYYVTKFNVLLILLF